MDIELMSLDTEWNAGKLKGSDSGAGESGQSDDKADVRDDMMSDRERDSTDVRTEGERVVE